MPFFLDNPQDLSGSIGDPNILMEDVPCDSGVAVGDVVKMVTGTAQKAQADSFNNSKFVGIVESKPTSTTCDIRTAGTSGEIFAGLTENEEYLLSPTTAGAIALASSIPEGSFRVRVGQAFSSTRLIVNKGTTQQL